MAKLLTSKEKLERDRQLVNKIKPKLRKFVGKKVLEATQRGIEAKAEQRKVLVLESLIRRGCEVAYIALVNKRIWEKIPPYMEMKWTRAVVITEALRRERDEDIAGFGSYLAREYLNYVKLKDTTKRGYLNPMNEENIIFFWSKFNADLRLLIEADKRRIALGEKGIVIADDKAKVN
jgi:hypothetical protein